MKNITFFGSLHAVQYSYVDYFANQFFSSKNGSGIPSGCHLDPHQFVRPDLYPNCLQRLSPDYVR